MNTNQRQNTAKYLYDISKGIALVAVVGNIVKDQWVISNLIIGLIAAIGFFIWGYFRGVQYKKVALLMIISLA